MGRLETFEKFLTTNSGGTPVGQFLVNLLLTAALCQLLSFVYVRFGTSLSNRSAFGRNFTLIGMTTMLIITIVKSSLALSLGLVGALSIVRFRTAIKEPEELAYVFVTIAIGLGFGADQRLITLAGFALIAPVLIWKGRARRKEDANNLYVTVASREPHGISLSEVSETLKPNCSGLTLKRFDESRDGFEASYLVNFTGYRQLQEATSALKRLNGSLRISLLDNDGVL